jgi:hypothetical protein
MGKVNFERMDRDKKASMFYVDSKIEQGVD